MVLDLAEPEELHASRRMDARLAKDFRRLVIPPMLRAAQGRCFFQVDDRLRNPNVHYPTSNIRSRIRMS